MGASARGPIVRNHLKERLSTKQFNQQEVMRWVATHLAPPQQPMPEAVVPGHYTSEDVTDEQFAEAYARATGRPYRKAVHTIKSNAAL